MWRSEANLAELRALYRGIYSNFLLSGGFFNVIFWANSSVVYVKNCFVKTLNESQIVLIDMQGTRYEVAASDITSVEKLKGIQVNTDTTMFVGDFLQQWISHVSYSPTNDEWSFTEKDVYVVIDDNKTLVSAPPPLVMYDLVLKQGDVSEQGDHTVMKYTDKCPSNAFIAALGSHKIVKSRSLTSGTPDNCIIVRTTSKLEPNLINNLVLWYAGSPMIERINQFAKLPEIASQVEDRNQFYKNHRIMLLANGKQITSPIHAPEFPMMMLLKPQ